ncbi:hypothetical protein ACNS7O_06035 [Haloferacaceae archaeon DSL9]
MRKRWRTRRGVLLGAGGILIGAGLARGRSASTTASDRADRLLMAGTPHETPVFETVGDEPGPTVMVVGGVHGNEVAGYRAAAEIAAWEIERGTLVTIPEADRVAVERRTRTGVDDLDLNRQIPIGGEPQTDLARALWDEILAVDPDILVDLHESRGLYAENEGLGQLLIHSRTDRAERQAVRAAAAVTDAEVDESRYRFRTRSFTHPNRDPHGIFTHKVDHELGKRAFVVETVSTGPDIDTRIRWHQAMVRTLAEDLFLPESELDRPAAAIETTPADAAAAVHDVLDTVTLDASGSSATDATVTAYGWDLTGNGRVDELGETIDLTLRFCGTRGMTLFVRDDRGRIGTARIALTTDPER